MIKIIKFGGTIVNNQLYFSKVENIIGNELNNNNKLVIVVSAIGRDNDPYSTSKLTNLGPNLNEKEKAELLSYGERISSLVFLNALKEKKYNAGILMIDEIGINLEGNYLEGQLKSLDNKVLMEKLEIYDILIVPGFIGLNNHRVGLLGLGGSDLTGIYLAKMLNIKEIYLYKDVDGVKSGDPKIIVDALTINKLSYDECLIFAKCGAKIVQNKAIEEAKKSNILINICAIMDLKVKTVIGNESSRLNFKGVMSKDDYIYLIFDNFEQYCKLICEILEKYNFNCLDIIKNPNYIGLKLEGGKRNFAMNILHHYFISKKIDL